MLIKGQVITKDSIAIVYANIYLKDIYDGGISNDSGYFSFATTVKGNATIVISVLGYQTLEMPVIISDSTITVLAIMANKVKIMDDVVVTAGTFEVSDRKRGMVIKSLDVVTTAGAAGDIYGALQTLPGVLPQSEETGIFVRGGAAHESKTVVDGLIIQNPFFGDVPDIPSRGRFNPFQFTGMVFSTGGYSAEYGQALSSVLLLNSSSELATDNVTSLNLSLVNASLTRLQRIGKNTTLAVGGGYSNNRLLISLNKQYREWKAPPEGYNATIGVKHKMKNEGLLKLQARYQHTSSSIFYNDIDSFGKKRLFSNQNPNFSSYLSFTKKVWKNWNLYAGAAAEVDVQKREYGDFSNPKTEKLFQGKSVLSRRINMAAFKVGYEVQHSYYSFSFDALSYRFQNTYSALFAETDISLSRTIVARIGARPEYISLSKSHRLSPRLALAFKTGAKSQVSLAYGHFYQNPQSQYWIWNKRLDFEKAVHFLANYQWIKDRYIFRVEAYYKKYHSLVRFDSAGTHFDNSGNGFAKGIDLFWRDNRATLKNLDYWISYSFINSKRSFRQLDFLAIPSFAPQHTVSVVAKREIPAIRSRIGGTYTWSSGRTFYSPAKEAEKTKSFQNLNINFSYQTAILKKFAVVYVSFNNLLNIDNVLAIRYTADGSNRQEIRPATRRSFFLGASLTL